RSIGRRSSARGIQGPTPCVLSLARAGLLDRGSDRVYHHSRHFPSPLGRFPAPARHGEGGPGRCRILAEIRRARPMPPVDPDLDRQFMTRAIEVTLEGIAAGQSPFGAVIVRDGAIVAATHNTVWRDGDPTAHAEVNCIRAAARALTSIDLSGCTMYS